ncbi:hypothetical protein CVT25_004778 [Psilocybe cyanescens]|uniref:Uncharacterized protein n=1 Tax=Psilocybe cyanescens TaxID=93625 RepID=A0A409XMW6_PSICY|nr:hypothetical protein CVT25_004778 [Psilocybe cyanescens]
MFFNDFLENQGEPLHIKKSKWPVIYEKYWQCFGNLKKEWKSWQAKEGKDNKEMELCNSQKKKKMQKVTRRDAR